MKRSCDDMKNPMMSAHYEAALAWIRDKTLDERGICYSSLSRVPYQEVTGYLVPTLFDAGEDTRALACADFLKWVQRASGAFTGIDGKEYVFDTAQVLRGLLAAGARDARYLEPARRAADFIAASIGLDGEIPSPYGSEIPGAVHLYALGPLRDASRVMGVKAWEDAALRALEFYLTRPATFDISVLTHYSAYITDGAIEMGASADVEGFARRIFLEQRPDGAIPALPGRAGWVCMSGVAQWAILGCKLGYRKEAEAALAYLGRTQELSGGFKGSTGRGAAYFPKDEVSWTVKFFLDAVHLFKGRTVSAGAPDREGLSPAQWHAAITGGVAAEALASRLRSGDIPAWCRPLLEQTAPGETVLELGSGAGELSAVMALYGRKVKLLDVSTENLAYARQVFAALGLEAEYIEADALKGIPLAEKSVDWVSSSGLLEHFNDDEVGALIRDSVRVCRRGVISLVPNARSLPYRAGKSAMEKSGAWPWGRERPAYSMRRFFEQAGLGQVEERTVAPYHALSFSRAPEPFREFYTTLSPDELSDLGQGYLLVTYGTR